MAQAWVPIFVKDRGILASKGMPPSSRLEWVPVDEEGPLLRGPVSQRVAILDFDPRDGRLRPGVPVRGSSDPSKRSTLRSPDRMEYDDPEAMAVSVFGTIYKTLRIYERPDCLGRRVTWAFGAPQLLVVPRAGEWPNAFYERESHSLQFFFFPDADSGRRVYAAQSQDIVAHETGHAILDAIAPDLYHAASPQALAIHEAVADLTAVLCSLQSKPLRRAALEGTGNSLEGWTGFSALAGEFGHALDPESEQLRNLYDRVAIHRSLSGEPHALSVVLSGALYRVLLYMYDEIRAGHVESGSPTPGMSAAGAAPDDDPSDANEAEQALLKAGRRFRRTVLRGLDYLPPGEISFGDFARAVCAADEASHPDSSAQRGWLAEELTKRGVVSSPRALEVDTMFEVKALRDLDLDELLVSEYLAYRFVEENRALLQVPDGASFRVCPRLDAHKATWHREGPAEIRELILKVSWTEPERVPRIAGLPWRTRQVVRGTSLVIDRPTRRARALLTSERSAELGRGRDRFLSKLLADGLLVDAEEARHPDGSRPRGAVLAEMVGGSLRTRNTAHALHFHRPLAPRPTVRRGARASRRKVAR